MVEGAGGEGRAGLAVAAGPDLVIPQGPRARLLSPGQVGLFWVYYYMLSAIGLGAAVHVLPDSTFFNPAALVEEVRVPRGRWRAAQQTPRRGGWWEGRGRERLGVGRAVEPPVGFAPTPPGVRVPRSRARRCRRTS